MRHCDTRRNTIFSNLLIDSTTAPAGAITEPVTLAEVKAYMKVDYTDEDALNTSLITEAREWAEKFTGLSLIPKSITVLVQVMNRYRLPFGPITSTLNTLVIKNEKGDTVTDARLEGMQFPLIHGHGKYSLTYNAGYTVIQVPASLKIAICARVLASFENRGDEWKDNFSKIAEQHAKQHRILSWA